MAGNGPAVIIPGVFLFNSKTDLVAVDSGARFFLD
jgi:hypothetical protein